MPFAALLPIIASFASQIPGLFKQGGQGSGGGAAADPAADAAKAAGGIKSLFSLGNVAQAGAAGAQGLMDKAAQKNAQGQALGSQLQAQAAAPVAPVQGSDPGLAHILNALRQIMANSQTPGR